MISTEKRYKSIIEQLQSGNRAIFNASPEELDQYQISLEKALDPQNTSELQQLFCILSNTQQKSLQYEELLMSFLGRSADFDTETLVMGFSAIRKHIIEAKQINGLRQSADFLKALEVLLFHPNLEVVEWTLRMVEELGPQAAVFKKHFPKLMPGLLVFNKHKKNIKDLVFILDTRFKSFSS